MASPPHLVATQYICVAGPCVPRRSSRCAPEAPLVFLAEVLQKIYMFVTTVSIVYRTDCKDECSVLLCASYDVNQVPECSRSLLSGKASGFTHSEELRHETYRGRTASQHTLEVANAYTDV